MNEVEIFKYLDPNKNFQLTELTNTEKKEMLIKLNKFFLTFRQSLNLKDDATFGFEIEFDDIDYITFYYQIKKYIDLEWQYKLDPSIPFGAEACSPILKDNQKSWKMFFDVCKLISSSATLTEECGSHIHVGANLLGDDINSWFNFIKLWASYENVIYRFLAGEFVRPRWCMAVYAAPVKDIYYETYNELKSKKNIDAWDIIDKISKGVNFNVNTCGIKDIDINFYDNTFEFRGANGSFNPVILQNNANFILKLLIYAKSDKFNDEVVNRRMQLNFSIFQNNEDDYSKIYLDQALELADLIFNNNLDKIYFLRQYIKLFEVDNTSFKKVKTFIK